MEAYAALRQSQCMKHWNGQQIAMLRSRACPSEYSQDRAGYPSQDAELAMVFPIASLNPRLTISELLAVSHTRPDECDNEYIYYHCK